MLHNTTNTPFMTNSCNLKTPNGWQHIARYCKGWNMIYNGVINYLHLYYLFVKTFVVYISRSYPLYYTL